MKIATVYNNMLCFVLKKKPQSKPNSVLLNGPEVKYVK